MSLENNRSKMKFEPKKEKGKKKLVDEDKKKTERERE